MTACVGRPTKYSINMAVLLCSEIADGKSMRTICASDNMPSMSTVFRWLNEKPEFKEQYEIAKQESADAMVEDMLFIADEIAALTPDGKVDSADVAHKRLRVDTRKWVAAKLKPKKYGDKQSVEVTGKDGGAIQTATAIDLSQASDALITELMALRVKPSTD